MYFSTSKPRPPKKSIYYQLVSRDRIRHFKKEFAPAEKRVREVYCYCTLSCDRLCFVTKSFWFIPYFRWLMENAWSDTSNDAIDGVSFIHWFPKDLNLRKILTSKVKIKRGQLDRFQRLQRYATVKNAQTTGPGQRLKLAQWHRMIALRDWNARECEWPDRMKLPF